MRQGVFCGVLVIVPKQGISNFESRHRRDRITKGVTSTFDIPCSIFCGSEKILIKPIVAILPLCQACPKVSFGKRGLMKKSGNIRSDTK
jgi:hypothetical protein